LNKLEPKIYLEVLPSKNAPEQEESEDELEP
jgi:hypothetical protein